MDIAKALHHIQELAHSVNHRAHCFQPFSTSKECMEAEPNLDNFTIDSTASNAAIFRCGVFLLMALGKTEHAAGMDGMGLSQLRTSGPRIRASLEWMDGMGLSQLRTSGPRIRASLESPSL
ncbi:hypothetical protein CsSME_00007022 [Camellia sinensis var. sinensis]